MIKKITTTWLCEECGKEVKVSREVIVDNYLKNIRMPSPTRCVCGHNRFLLADLSITSSSLIK